MKQYFRNFRIIDADKDFSGDLIATDGIITDIFPRDHSTKHEHDTDCDLMLDGKGKLVLAAGLIDMHAHFRDPGFLRKETLESASIAAACGGYTTAVCMANTRPVTAGIKAAKAIKERADVLGLIDLYPAICLTKNMQGKSLSNFLEQKTCNTNSMDFVRLLSEDGKDVQDDALFLAALKKAALFNLPVSCHCDLNGENSAVKRAVKIGKISGCALHIAHISTKQSVEFIRALKADGQCKISAEATPHHIALNSVCAKKLGADTFGKVAPPLRSEQDRMAVIEGLRDGTIDAIATDHAPHTFRDKQNGAPGFCGIETAFAVCYSVLCKEHGFSLQKLMSLMSSSPAKLLGFTDRGKLEKGLRADFTLIDTQEQWNIAGDKLHSKGKNTPYSGNFSGKIVMTFCAGKISSG